MKSNILKNQIGIVSRSHLGMVRHNQEDNHLYSTNIRDSNCWHFYSESVIDEKNESVLLLVADGMGGLEMGENASEIACKTTKNYCIENAQSLLEGNNLQSLFNNLFVKINNDILTFAKEQSKAGELGTTLIISFVINKKAHVFWIGDSRCYVIRKGILKPISKDHSYVQGLVDQGKITYEQSFYHPESNIITKYMGDPKTTPVPSYTSLEIEDGDILLLCSDGLNGMLQDIEIQDHFYNNDDLISICQNLIDSANEAGGHDNNTIILAAFGDFAKCIPHRKIVSPVTNSNSEKLQPQIITETKLVYKLNWKMAALFFLLGTLLTLIALFAYNKLFDKKHKDQSLLQDGEQTHIIENVTQSQNDDVDDATIIESETNIHNNINTNNHTTIEQTGQPNFLILQQSTKDLVNQLLELLEKYPPDSVYYKDVKLIGNHRTNRCEEEGCYKNKQQLIRVFNKGTENIKNNSVYSEKIKELENNINKNY
jgi:serine/threonine protein phosphatase PrpC